MEQKKSFDNQIITALALTVALALIVVLVIILRGEVKVNNIDSLCRIISFGLQFVVIIVGAYGFFILYQKSDTIQSEINNIKNTDKNVKSNSNELKEIRLHHLAERYIEEVYPALLRNTDQKDSQQIINQKETIALLNAHICNIIGKGNEQSCIKASIEGNIVNVAINDVFNNELIFSYRKDTKILEVSSPTATNKFIYRNGCIISVEDGLIVGIESPL